MIQKLKKNITAILMTLAVVSPMLVPSLASANVTQSNINQNLCSGTNISLQPDGTSCAATGSTSHLDSFLRWAVDIFSAFVGIIAVIMIIVGGLKYITSGGDSGKVGSAKNTLLYAIIGLIVVALAQIIVRWVIGWTSNSFSNGF